MSRFLTLSFVAALSVPGSGLAGHATIDFGRLSDDIERIRVETGVPGAAVVIVDRDDIPWSGEFGIADTSSYKAITPETVFRIGSVTKIFTAVALVQLARRDDFSLDDAVSERVPPGLFYNQSEHERPITVAHLLEHTSGFRDWTKAEFDYNVPVSLEQGLAFSPQSRTVHWKPGLHSVYSNSNYGLAGLVLKRVSGQDYESFLRAAVFSPLGMRSATSLQERTTNLATGYDGDGKTPIPYWHMIQRPAAAINAAPREMAALVSMLLNRGRYHEQTVLTPAEVQRIETPLTSLAARNNLRFGYGLGIYSYYHNGFRFMGHGGDGDGYLSRFGYCRELGVGYFVSINSANPSAMGHMRRAIEDALTHGHHPPPSPPVVQLDQELLRRYTGRYSLAAWRFDWQTPGRSLLVGVDAEGSLYTQDSDGQRTPLLAVSDHTFRRAGEAEATSGFFEADDVLFFQEDDNWMKMFDAANDAAQLHDQGNGALGSHRTGEARLPWQSGVTERRAYSASAIPLAP